MPKMQKNEKQKFWKIDQIYSQSDRGEETGLFKQDTKSKSQKGEKGIYLIT